MSEEFSSPSSSEDEEDHSDSVEAPADPVPTESQRLRFQCPADFVSFNYKPCSSNLRTSSNKNNNTELWLIKAPSGFNPQSFTGVHLPLRGLETVSVPSTDGAEQVYSVLGSSRCSPELRLLAPPGSLAPPFSGMISICESHDQRSTDGALHVIPAVPPPSLPPGLKQRFQHFQTTGVCGRQAEGEAKRKRKKEKKIKSELREREEVTHTEMVIKTEIKQEPLGTNFGEQPEFRKKKKKKKKNESAD